MLRTLAEKLDPQHTALLVIDMQNDFCDEEGACARNGEDVRAAQAIVPTILELAAGAREARALVVFVRVSHDENTSSEVYMERRREGRIPTCIEGTWGAEWYGDLRPQPSDVVLTKHRYSAFINTPLDLVLRSRGIRAIVASGTATNVCVESTARDGYMLDYYVVLPEDAAAAFDPAAHAATLQNIRKHFGEVVTAADVLAVWRDQARAALEAGASPPLGQ